ncbi:MAG: hypothetical protein LBB54_04415 [Cellulomonadaceae bacterium]|jgi:hypothetical protein|nr:hypothetical protein [Cellulomonadaceae bacterium]
MSGVAAVAPQLTYTLKSLAAATPFSEKVLRQAVTATDPAVFPPPLKAKARLDAKGRVLQYLIDPADYTDWFASLPDA